jgi:hypothetical protein
MIIALHVVAFAAGVYIIFSTLLSAVRSTILPRAVTNRLTRLSIALVRAASRLWTGRSPSYERRDRIMAMFGPIVLLLLLLSWLLLLVTAYVLIYVAIGIHPFTRDLELSGSSIVTLGNVSATSLWGDILTYSEAGLGLLILTLLITYLPSIYGAFSRRENGVALLTVRAGSPPNPATMLIRYHRIESTDDRLNALWQLWEGWFVDIEETHTSFPILAFFRSPQPDQSWITAAGTLLDGAALWVSVVQHPRDPDAQLCLRAGFQTLRRIAGSFKIVFDDDPAPEDPITISRSEWDAQVARMEEAGIPLVEDRDAAWDAWRGWRVNYDTVLLDLARAVEAPPVPWVSDRTPVPLRGHRRMRRLRRSPALMPGGDGTRSTD